MNIRKIGIAFGNIWSFIERHWKLAAFFGNIILVIIISVVIVIALDAPKSSLYFAYEHLGDLERINAHLQQIDEAKGAVGLQDEESRILSRQ